MTTAQFWHVMYRVRQLGDGAFVEVGDIARDEDEARLRAILQSRESGHANIMNNEGLFATYINGFEQR